MTDTAIMQLLPTRPPHEVRRAAADDPELHPTFITYRRVSVDPEELGEWRLDIGAGKRRYRWGGLCRCTSCGEEFYTGWHSHGDMSGPLMCIAEDDEVFPGWVDNAGEDDIYCGYQRIELTEGDSTCCPMCGELAQFIKYSSLKSGRSYQRLYTSVELVGNLFALVTWIARETITADGTGDMSSILPRDAAVLTERGSLRCYAHTRRGEFITCEAQLNEWRRLNRARDPMQRLYYSYDSNAGRTFGSWILSRYSTFAGTSAEKTGVEEYIRAGGQWPYVYLNLWRAHKNIENLMKTGWQPLVVEAISDAVERGTAYNMMPTNGHGVLDDTVDWGCKKPHEMLGMSKAEFKQARGMRWREDMLRLWQLYDAACEPIQPAELMAAILFYGRSAIDRITDLYIVNEDSLLISDLDKYAAKQPEREGPDTAGLLIDYRQMLYEAYPDRTDFTSEELWPRDLLAAHDRLADQLAAEANADTAKNFAALKAKLKPLEWSDGELCIVCPTSNADLVAEGKTLRHCVGGYGKKHLSGTPIFFIRHARRPERSYYTLNEDLRGDTPRRMQLHGYGNEHHGPHKEYRHSIPAQVLEFCARWEKEILAPWHAAEQAKKNEVKNKRKKEKKAA